MRLSRSVLVKLTVLGVLVIVLYCLQTSNVSWTHLVNHNGFFEDNETTSVKIDISNKNDIDKKLKPNLNNNFYKIFRQNIEKNSAKNFRTNFRKDSGVNFINNLDENSEEKFALDIDNNNENLPKKILWQKNRSLEDNHYNVWSIFTKVTSNSPMRRKFRIFTESLIKYSTINLTFHVISDTESQLIADNVIKLNSGKLNRSINVQYYDVHKLANELKDIVSVMSPKFSSKPGTYYSDALFFLSLGIHRIASSRQKYAVMLDVDTKLRTDVKLLFKEFDGFGEQALFGLAPELTPVYRHVLYLYRNKNPSTMFGEPYSGGGYPGYNSGVVLFHLERLRNSLEYDQIVSEDMVMHMTEKYSFKGHLGDQDFYTLLGMERPELIHPIDCGWNRQLCTWWRDRGYADVFDNYFKCDSTPKIWHGNCNTPVPED